MSSPSIYDTTGDTIRLQGIGLVAGQPARNIQVGDVLIWNYGQPETVIAIVKETSCFITIVVECKTTLLASPLCVKVTGIAQGDRKLGKDRIVCIATRKHVEE